MVTKYSNAKRPELKCVNTKWETDKHMKNKEISRENCHFLGNLWCGNTKMSSEHSTKFLEGNSFSNSTASKETSCPDWEALL